MKGKVIILILGVVFLANVSFGSGDSVRSEINLKTINSYIEDNPHDPNLYFVKGQILLENNRIRKAKQVFEKVINFYPGYDEAYFELAKIDFRLKEFTLAIGNIDEYLAKNPTDGSALFIKGEILIAAGEYNQVLKVADQILQMDNEDDNAYLLKGEANFELGNFDTAYENWRVSKNLGNVEAAVHLKYLFEPVW